MKHLVATLLLCLAARGADAPVEPEVLTAAFEPPLGDFFKSDDKFAHPPETTAPRFLFPFEFRRHGGAVTPAEVVILVQLDGHGHAKKLKVLTGSYEPFTRSAIDALKKAQWDSAREVWFYYRHVYTGDDLRTK